MGNAFSSCSCKKHRVASFRDITLLMIGLDNAGKTCTAKHLLGDSTADAVPTVGFSSIQVKHGKHHVTIYDLGGGPKIRGIWKNYFALVHGLIFVVDASHPQRLEECKAEIKNVLTNEKIAGKPMLLLVNKQDVSGAIDETELVSRLELEALVNEQKCPTRVETSCAIFDESKVKDPGIQEGFHWLVGLISRDFNALHDRVEKEVAEQKRVEEKEKAERMERVRRIREERERLAENLPQIPNESQDDDDDVVVGNPFKSCDLIKAELEERERNKVTPSIKVIHVSPTNSDESREAEVVLHPGSLNDISRKTYSKSDSDMFNGSAMHSFSSSQEEEMKRRAKKGKKRFKNRIVPESVESTCISQPSRLNGLPPLRPTNDAVVNGQPSIYTSPKRSTFQNGKINWAMAEELVPCRETAATGSSVRRIEAWPDVEH